MSQNSALRMYSEGVAASNKQLNTNQLSVVPYEVTPLIDGELDDIVQEMLVKGKDSYGIQYEIKLKSTQALTCDWLPFGALPITAPDIRRGERVVIYRFADSNKYYWVDKGLDRHLRRLETIIWRVAATPDGDKDVDLDETNCYYITMSSHQKLISLTTSMANGEHTSWTVQIDLAEGNLVIANGNNDFIQIISKEQLIHLQNAAGAFVKLSKQDILGYAPKDMMLEAVALIQAKCKDFKVIASNTAVIDAASSVLIKTPETTIQSEQTTMTGNAEVGKDLKVVGRIDADKGTIGGVSFDNGVMTCRTLTASQPISAPNV